MCGHCETTQASIGVIASAILAFEAGSTKTASGKHGSASRRMRWWRGAERRYHLWRDGAPEQYTPDASSVSHRESVTVGSSSGLHWEAACDSVTQLLVHVPFGDVEHLRASLG